MKVTIYYKKVENPSTPNHVWVVDAPQVIAFAFGPTKEAARQEMMETAMAQFALYCLKGYFTEHDIRTLHFVEEETTMTSKELTELCPEWYKEAIRKGRQEAAAAG